MLILTLRSRAHSIEHKFQISRFGSRDQVGKSDSQLRLSHYEESPDSDEDL